MPKKPGAYHRPKSMADALALLNQPGSVILAGGTKLLANEEGLAAEHVVDLQQLGLDQISASGRALTIGATCTLARLLETLARDYPGEGVSAFLRPVLHREGPNTYRNAATIGGSVAARLPDSELLAALLTLEAMVHFGGVSPVETMPLADYLLGEERPGGLISAVQLNFAAGRGATERVARTPADYPIVSVIAWQPEGAAVRLAASGLGLRPQRLPAAEEAVAGGLNAATIDDAAAAAAAANRHPGDFRGDAAYRAQMARVLTRRALQTLA